MVLCGAFPSLLAARTTSGKKKDRSEEDFPTVFTFQISPRGSRGSITPGIAENFSSRSFESTRSSSWSHHTRGEASEASRRRRQRRRNPTDNVGEFRNGRKALFDAATESESICTDPLLGSVVDVVTDTTGEEQRRNDIDDLPKNYTRRQMLWHAALQHHRSRHGKIKQQISLKQKQLNDLDRIVIQQRNDSKESLNTNIRRRGLSNIQQYLPSVSYSAGTDCDLQIYQQQQLQQRHRKDNSNKYCPLCSCRLTYLYYSSTSRRLTEIHSGCDTPSSKADSALPPYCIGCRAYLISEQWEEQKRKMLLKNFETRLDVTSPSSSNGDEVKGGPLEDFKNGRIIVVGLPSHESQGVNIRIDTSLSDDAVDQNDAVTPFRSEMSSEVSSVGSNSNGEEYACHTNENKFTTEINPRPVSFSASSLSNSNRGTRVPEFHAHGEQLLTHTHPCHRKDRILLHSHDEKESVDTERREDCGNANNGYNGFGVDGARLEVRDDEWELEGDDYQSDYQSHIDPFFDLNDDDERVPPENDETPFTNTNVIGVSDRAVGAVSDQGQNVHGQIPSNPNQSVNNHPPYEIIDQTITFKSPTLAAQARIAEARLAVASTFSEEFAIFQNYSIKKEAATKQIAKCLHKGYELTSVKCEQCDMPMMTRGEEGATCVSCPAIMKKVRRMVKEKRNPLNTSPVIGMKRNHLRTPKTSNKRGDLVQELGSYNEAAEETIDQSQAIDCGQAYIDIQNRSDFVREVVSGEEEEVKSMVPSAAISRGEADGSVEILDKIEQGLFSTYNQNTEQHDQSVSNRRDYWVSYTELHNNNGPQPFLQPSLFSESSLGGLQHPIRDQCMFHQNDHLHQPFSRQSVHLRDTLASESNEQNIQEKFPYNNVNVASQLNQNGIHPQDASYPESTHYHHFSAKEGEQQLIEPQSSFLDTNVTSTAAGRDYYQNPSLEDSVESITKCPRNLPSSEQIWHYNSSDYIMGRPYQSFNHSFSFDGNQVMTNQSQYLNGNQCKPPIRELNWQTNPTHEVMRSHLSHNSYPSQSSYRTEKTYDFDLVDTGKSPDGASSFKSIHSEFLNTNTANVRCVEETSHGKKHSLSPEPCLEENPKNKENIALWNERVPLSFELNSNMEQPTRTHASNQNWSAPQLRTADQIHAERLELPVRLFEGTTRPTSPMLKPLVREHRDVTRLSRNSPSYGETKPFSPLNEKKFCERIDDLTTSLKRATSQFESRIMARQKRSNDDHTQQPNWGLVPLSDEGHISSLGDASLDPFLFTLHDNCSVSAKSVQHSSPNGRKIPNSCSRDSESNDNNHLVESQLKTPPLLHGNVRKPLEPMESGNGDENRHQLHSSADHRITGIDVYSSDNIIKKTNQIRERKDPVTPKRSGSDPPGHKPARSSNGFAQRSVRETTLVNNNHSPRNMDKKIQEPLDPITRNQYGADPPESDYSHARGADPEYTSDKCVHRGIAFAQNSSRLECSSKTGIASLEKKDANQSSPKRIFTPQQSTCTDMQLSENVCSSSSSYPKRLMSLAPKGLVQLNIPSWVDDEIDTPIKPAKSFGETSMDRLLRKIDEIENDFSTIVASLPGSDGLSLKASKSDDNSTLATKSTFEIHQGAEQINHQLASESFESHGSHRVLMTGILQQMRLVQDQIEQLECSELDDGSEGDYESQGEMAELIQRLANAAESLRSLQVE
ncbi:hypothetical protein ACHAW6_016016 [Cyclotella cf. meneghiniana]